MNYKVLAMNFGSTSTKVAIYEGSKEVISRPSATPMRKWQTSTTWKKMQLSARV